MPQLLYKIEIKFHISDTYWKFERLFKTQFHDNILIFSFEQLILIKRRPRVLFVCRKHARSDVILAYFEPSKRVSGTKAMW